MLGALQASTSWGTYRHGGEDVVDVLLQAGIHDSGWAFDDHGGLDPCEVAFAVVGLGEGAGWGGLLTRSVSQVC